MVVEYFGHAAFLLQTKKANILIDPFLTGNPFFEKTLDALPVIDYIFVTHGHGDHLGDTLEIAKKTGATVVANPEICHYLQLEKVMTVQPSGYIPCDFGRFKAVVATHTSSIDKGETKIDGGMAFGYVFDVDGLRLYHAGDTGLHSDMALLKDEAIDVALLPIGGYFTMDIMEARRAATMIAPKTVIPMHYNTFDVIQEDPTNLKIDGIETIIMAPHETITFN